jgi:zinc D-Ala-D-Ala carboxypeptidase
MKLSQHFDLSEFTISQTASRLGIDNDPPSHILPKLNTLAAGMEMVRELLGDNPISISSGYRSAAINAAVKGSQGSQHLLGEACDFTCPSFGMTFDIVQAIVQSDIQYDQVIAEFGNKGWVHISFSTRNRKQALIIDSAGTRAFV